MYTNFIAFIQRFKMSLGLKCWIMFMILGIAIEGLHLQDSTQAQIDALMQQQTSFEKTFNNLVKNISQVEQAINQSSSTQDKILILENAIESERESVYEMSKIIIPPFNISKESCQKMTDQQKVELLEQLEKARNEVYALRNISYTMPKCDDVDQINRDIEKEIFFLNSIESIIYTNCSMNVILSPTIFQTNIYAQNWTLGNMTIDDLIEQYYQRSIKYDNITNCPIGYPFFDGKQCIICPSNNPYFDISQRKCISCPKDQHLDNQKKQCVPDDHYTNWTSVNNFSPKDGPFPTPEEGSTPCPKSNPYYNGTGCINCSLPQYFSIPNQKCMNCSQGQKFDLNVKQCRQFQPNMLTQLIDTRWVTPTSNLTNVLQERADIMEKNKTSGDYFVCPDAQPYYDGISCIQCPNEFDLNQRKCVNKTVFDPNLHIYLNPEDKESNQNAPNYVGTKPPDTPTPDCNQTYPFYDDIACVNCPKPFEIFDYDSKRCIACDPTEIYNSSTHICQKRPMILISQNEDRLMATPYRSIDDYHDNITQTIQNNPDAIIINCEDPTYYSNYSQCFPCSSTQYFNVQKLKCDTCPSPGQINSETRICEQASYLFTNLSAPNIVNFQTSKEEEQARINQLLSENNKSRVCNLSLPYSDGQSCFNCTAPYYFFDYTNKMCIGCPDGSFYNNGTCYQKPIVSNISQLKADGNYIENPPNYTLAKLQENINKYNQSGIPYEQCSASLPYYNQTTKKCVNTCRPAGVLSLQTGQCIVCSSFNQTNHSCPPPRPPAPYYPNMSNPNWIVSDNNTQKVVDWRNKLASVPGAQQCAKGAEFYNNQACQPCPAGTYFNYQTFQCVNCAPLKFDINIHNCIQQAPNNTYQTNLGRNNLVFGGIPKGQWNDYYNGNVTAYPNIKDCPPNFPYYDGINCIMCPSNVPYFNMKYRLCQVCPNSTSYSSSLHECMNSDGSAVWTVPDPAKMFSNIF